MSNKDPVPNIKREYNSERELIEDVSAHLVYFKKYYIQLRNSYETLKNAKKEFPSKYLTNDDFEDLMLKASQAKNMALDFSQIATGVSSELDTKLTFFISYLQIHIADDALKALNFPKVTDVMRERYIHTKKEVIELTTLKDRFEVLSSSFDKMFKMFSDDEINFRRFLEKKDKMIGLK